MKTYGFGIIGCGMISQFHADGLAEVPNAKLIAVSSRTEANRQKMAAKYGCDAHADYHELVQRQDIDIITIATPSGAHLEPALAAARAGKHVIVEKPIEITLDRCDTMIKACRESNVMLCGIFPYRFTPGARALKQAVDQGRFGRITLGDAYNKWYRNQNYYDRGAWRGTWKLDGGGACMNQGIHAVDLIQWYMGPVDTITAFTDCLTHERIEIEDTAVAAVRYKSGALGVIECATSVYPGFPRKIEIHGDKGAVIMEQELFAKWEFEDELPEDAEIRETLGLSTVTKSGAADPSDITHVNFREEFNDFLTALEGGAIAPIDGFEARKALEIIMAMYQSGRTGQSVKLTANS